MIIRKTELNELLFKDDIKSIRDRLQIISGDLDLLCNGELPPSTVLDIVAGDCQTMLERIAELRKILTA